MKEEVNDDELHRNGPFRYHGAFNPHAYQGDSHSGAAWNNELANGNPKTFRDENTNGEADRGRNETKHDSPKSKTPNRVTK